MKSVTKNRLTDEDIKRIISAHFPDETVSVITEMKEGMFNATYLIEGSGCLKDKVVLKVGPASGTKLLTYEKDIIKTEVNVYGMLGGKDVPVPKVLVSDYSRKIVPCDYFIMTFAEGKTWKNCDKKLIRKSRSRLVGELGKYNAVVHSITGEWFGYIKDDKSFQFDNWYDAFFSMVQNILSDGKRDAFKLPYKKIEDAIRRNRKALDKVKTPQLVSFDIWAGNVFLKQAGSNYTVSGLIDFERSFYGDPLADFTAAMMIYSDVEKEPEFIAGYNKISGIELKIGKTEQTRMTLYRMYMALLLCVETYRYGKAYATVVKWYARRQIKKFLKELSSQ